ncbi:hypothetical protein LR021_01610 [Candidatus Bipolaricaulota bacterium]|nr:hypothetical protein [Candidatus Bipolaricaulota bacterium]
MVSFEDCCSFYNHLLNISTLSVWGSNSHFSVITTLCRFVVVTLVAGYAAVTTEVVTTTP